MRVNMVDVFCIYIWQWNVEIVLRRGRGKRENNGGGKSKTL
jgi:hypothetical protein